MQKLSNVNQAMSMHNASNLQKELLAMSTDTATTNAVRETESQFMKSKKGKTSSRSSFSQNKSMPQQFHNSSRSKDGAFDYASSKTNDNLQSSGYSRYVQP